MMQNASTGYTNGPRFRWHTDARGDRFRWYKTSTGQWIKVYEEKRALAARTYKRCPACGGSNAVGEKCYKCGRRIR